MATRSLSLGDLFATHLPRTDAGREHWSRRMVDEARAQLARVAPNLGTFSIHVFDGTARSAQAFTTQGRRIFVNRHLVAHCGKMEAIAFVIAHEYAHHALGHLRRAPRFVSDLGWLPLHVAWTLLTIPRGVRGAEAEREADAHALDLCMEAGMDARSCIYALVVMEQAQLNWRNVDAVYGPAAFYDGSMDERARRQRMARHLRRQGYYPTRVRRLMLMRQAGLGTGGVRLAV